MKTKVIIGIIFLLICVSGSFYWAYEKRSERLENSLILLEADSQCQNRSFSDALKTLKAFDIEQEELAKEKTSEYFLIKGQSYLGLGKYNKSIKELLSAIELEENEILRDNTILFDSFLALASAYTESHQYSKASEVLDILEKSFSEELMQDQLRSLKLQMISLTLGLSQISTFNQSETKQKYEDIYNKLKTIRENCEKENCNKEKLIYLEAYLQKLDIRHKILSDNILVAIKSTFDYIGKYDKSKNSLKVDIILELIPALLQIGKYSVVEKLIDAIHLSYPIKTLEEARFLIATSKIEFFKTEYKSSRDTIEKALKFLIDGGYSESIEIFDAMLLVGGLQNIAGNYQESIKIYDTILDNLYSVKEENHIIDSVRSNAAIALTDIKVKLESITNPIDSYKKSLEYLKNNYTNKTIDEKINLYKRISLIAQEQGSSKAQLPIFFEAEKTLYEHLNKNISILDFEKLQSRYEEGRIFVDLLLSDTSYSEKTIEIAIKWKNLLQRLKELPDCNSNDEKSNTKLAELRSEIQLKKRKVNNLLLAQNSKKAKISDLEIWTKKENIETLYNQYLGLCGKREQIESISNLFEQLRLSLPPKTVFIDYIKFNKYEPKMGSLTLTSYYSAIVFDNNTFHLIRLDNADKIESLVNSFRGNLQNPNLSHQEIQEKGKELYEILIQRSLVGYGRPQNIVIAPDGELHALSFAALPGRNKGQYLIEETAISYANSALDIERWNREKHLNKESMLAAGNPLFNNSKKNSVDRILRGITPCMTSTWLDNLSPLPGTEKEIVNITNIYTLHTNAPISILMQEDVTEENLLRNMPKYRYIHLSTHGFFFSKQCFSIENIKFRDSRNTGQKSDIGEKFFSKPELSIDFKMSFHEVYNHPEMLSGIVLSNPSIKPDAKSFDNLLTAYELNNVDLSGVEFISLAACQTGAGELVSGMGVMGLKLALINSGVKGFMLTLWSIPDNEQFITSFYESYFGAETIINIPKIIRKASLECLENKNSLISHPRNWAAYTYTGPIFKKGSK